MSRHTLRWLAPLAVVAVLLGAAISHFASEQPDGLEQVAKQQDFAKREKSLTSSPMPDYEVTQLGGRTGKTAAGLAGVLLAFGLIYGVGRLLARKRREPSPGEQTTAEGTGPTTEPRR